MTNLEDIDDGFILLRRGLTKGGNPASWNNLADPTLPCSFLEHTVAHEAGHAFGIGWPDLFRNPWGDEILNRHPTNNTKSIMSYRAKIDYCTPQAYDVVAITANYQSR